MFRNSTDNKLFDIAAVNSKNHTIHYEKTAMDFEDACEEVQTLNAIFEDQVNEVPCATYSIQK